MFSQSIARTTAFAAGSTQSYALGGTQFLKPEFYLSGSGPLGSAILPTLLIVVFIESGLLFPFLPGDSLLFTAGLLAVQPDAFAPLWLLLVTAPIAAFLGDQVGYWIGHKFEAPLRRRPDGRIFKQAYLRESHDFFAKYGPATVIICRFVPIVRTYAPLVAGMSGMHYRTFVTYNAVGAVAWAAGVTWLGSLLGHVDFVREHIDALLVGIILVSVIPMIIAAVRKLLVKGRVREVKPISDPTTKEPPEV